MLERLKKSKKGNLFDSLFIVLFIIILGVTMLTVGIIMNRVNTHFDEDTEDLISVEGKEGFSRLAGSYTGIMDYIFIFAFLVLHIGVIISAFFIRTHPIFFFVAILLLIIFAFLSMVFQNIFYNLVQNPIFAEIIEEYTFMPFIILNLTKISIVISVIVAIILYAKGGEFAGI